jgi:hypothetical protein
VVTKYNQEVILVTDYVFEITKKRVCDESSAPDFCTGVPFVFAEPYAKPVTKQTLQAIAH